jgi:predicted transcriptional regulator
MTELVPSDRELEALKILWQQGRATVREIWERMRDREGRLAYTTVLSLLQVMEQKGLVGHEAVGKAYSYFALVERTATFRTLASGFLERVFDGALDEYLAHALGQRRASAAELERLERMIADAKRKTRRGGKGTAE